MATTTVTNTIGLTFEYDDNNTRNYTFTGMDNAALMNLKARVIELNATLADSVAGAAYHETFISDDGAPVKKVSKAKYSVMEEQVIYRG